MREINWVYGVSAAGKETFIRRVVQDRPKNLLKQFNWQGKTIVASQVSLDVIGFYEDDKVTEKREDIVDEVVKLAETNDVVLIKGQFVGYRANRQRQLKQLLPDLMHKIIYIQVQPEDLVKRLASKPWWSGDHEPEEWIADETLLVSDLLDDLGQDFSTTKVTGNTGSNYEIVEKN